MKVVVIDYNAGNTQSVLFCLNRIGIEATLTSNHEQILGADKVILPGVGEASSTMNFLKEKNLHTLIPTLTQPVIGICLGMHLMCDYCEEGQINGMGIFPLSVNRFIVNSKSENKVPHMGWNKIENLKSPIFEKEQEGTYVYFVHSYYVESSEYTIGTCNYIEPFSAAIKKDNFYAVQFHPEKSGQAGQKILKRFIEI